VGDVISGEIFGRFGSGTRPWAPTTRWNFLTKFLLERRLESKFLRLIGFLPFLVQKLWH